MAIPLLETRLRPPGRRPGAVQRSRLVERLDGGARSKLTLLSAPPGFGKSTLLADWIAGRGPETRTAWLSLDAGDNEPATFWTYLVAALETAGAIGGTAVRAAVDSAPPQVDLVISALLNDLATHQQDVVLVLDDLHVIERPEIHDGLARVLDRLPATAHVVVATRADPPLPLSRLRARGELTEIRAADLRFMAHEAADYLNGTMGLQLTGADVAALEGRTEGWIAALQLAALSMQGRDDVGSFIASFEGTDRYVVDYLADEVLARQSEEVRAFLLQTAVLDRLTAPLCDALTGRSDGRTMLEAIDRANLFLVPLDNQRRWYRYHHLFADVLRARLLDEQPSVIPDLHRRASAWFGQAGDRSEAIRHAMAAKDLGRAADLIELAIPDVRKARQEVGWRRWLDALPDEAILARPVLSVGYVGVLMSTGEWERAERLLEAAERWLSMPETERSANGMVVVDAEEFDRLPGAIAMYRTAQARMRGDVRATMDQARRVLELAAEDDDAGRGAGAAFLGLAHWTTGDLDEAHRWYTDGMASLERAGHLADVVIGAVAQADIRIGQGRLTDALAALQRALALATGSGPAVLRGAPNVHVGISDILRERNDLTGAKRHLDEAHRLGEEAAFPQYAYRSRLVEAQIRQAEGDAAGALHRLDEAAAAFVGEFLPDMRPIAALRARLWLAEGELSRAWGWARGTGLSASDDLTYLREFEHATLARLLLAQGVHDGSPEVVRQAIELAERLVGATDAGGRTGSVLDALVVLALARHAVGDAAGALESVERGADLAEPEGYVRVFVDEGRPMAALLKLAAKPPAAHGYLRRLAGAARGMQIRHGGPQALIEPLSERELEVLRLLATDLDGPAIARELVVSLSTVRTHTKNIYAKLGVNDRRAAVRRAKELDLPSRSTR